MKSALSVVLGFCASMAWGALEESILLEAEAFQSWGGWVNDTQFMDQMGSPYLLAHGLGCPVADAVTKLVVKSAGTYSVWVRTKNWTGPWHEGVGAGVFRVAVNGREMPIDLGSDGRGEWLWSGAGVVALSEGENEIALRDKDGFDGRCDKILFSLKRDLQSALKDVAANGRRELGNRTDVDLCVVGGGVAGICAAVSAARLGLAVALVQDRPVLGGNNSSEVRVHLGAWQNMPPYPRLGDIVAEIGPRKGGNAEPAETYEDDRKLAVVKAEPNIRLFLNTHMCGAVTNAAGAVQRIEAVNTIDGHREEIYARWFVDCTGDGSLGYRAGADFRQGREARDEHGEPWAPEVADSLTMGASVQWYAGKGETCGFPRKGWMVTFSEESASRGLKGDWWWEAGLGRDQIAEAEYIRDYGLMVAYSNWAFLKNESSKKFEYDDKELKWVAYNAGRRESRRLLGDFILAENDLMEKNFQTDGTCATTWTIDLHLPKSKKETKFEGEPFQTDSLNHVIYPYPVPYRCLYSRNVPNLFMAGRDISVTHVALGTTRLMRTHGMMGEVVGMAASLCKKHGCDPREIYTRYFDELRCLMEKGVGDGRPHPPQMYNIQRSLSPDFDSRRHDNFQIRHAQSVDIVREGQSSVHREVGSDGDRGDFAPSL